MSQFQKQIRNLATLDVLRVCYSRTYVAMCSYASPCCGINIYNILAWASRCCSNLLGNATASVRGTTTVEFHVFLCRFVMVLGGFYCLRQKKVVKKFVNFANWGCESGCFLR